MCDDALAAIEGRSNRGFAAAIGSDKAFANRAIATCRKREAGRSQCESDARRDDRYTAEVSDDPLPLEQRRSEWQIEVRIFSVDDAKVIDFDRVLFGTGIGVEFGREIADGACALCETGDELLVIAAALFGGSSEK